MTCLYKPNMWIITSQLLSGYRLFINNHDYRLNQLIAQPYFPSSQFDVSKNFILYHNLQLKAFWYKSHGIGTRQLVICIHQTSWYSVILKHEYHSYSGHHLISVYLYVQKQVHVVTNLWILLEALLAFLRVDHE